MCLKTALIPPDNHHENISWAPYQPLCRRARSLHLPPPSQRSDEVRVNLFFLKSPVLLNHTAVFFLNYYYDLTSTSYCLVVHCNEALTGCSHVKCSWSRSSETGSQNGRTAGCASCLRNNSTTKSEILTKNRQIMKGLNCVARLTAVEAQNQGVITKDTQSEQVNSIR